jgi:hypothetical protein
MTQPLYRVAAKSHRQRRRLHDSVALALAWLDPYIAPWPSHLGSAITSMTQQHYSQHDLASTLHRSQVAPAASSPAWLGSTVVSMTRHLHRVATKSPQQRRRQHDLAAPSPIWLGIYITPLWSHPGNAVISMTRQHRHQHDSASTSRHGEVASAMLSPAWLASMSRPLHHVVAKSPQQRRHQYDSVALSPAWIDIYIMSQPRRLGSAIASMTQQHFR